MRPTDTTRTLFVNKSRRRNRSKSKLTCQLAPPKAEPRPSFSKAILLLNFEPSYRESVALVLRFPGLHVVIPEEHSISLTELKDDELRQADFILFDLTRLDHDAVWLPLRRICRLRKADGMPLMVHCFSRIYRGPEFQLLVEKLGARLAYYAE